MNGPIRSFTYASLVALGTLVAAACSDDDASGTSSSSSGSTSSSSSSGSSGSTSSSSSSGGGNACEPEGTYAMGKATWTSSGGKVCDELAADANRISKESDITLTKTDATTYVSGEPGATNDTPVSFTLDASKCTLSGVEEPQSFMVDDGAGNEVEITLEGTDTIVISGKTLTFTGTGQVTSKAALDGVPCTITGTRTGTKK